MVERALIRFLLLLLLSPALLCQRSPLREAELRALPRLVRVSSSFTALLRLKTTRGEVDLERKRSEEGWAVQGEGGLLVLPKKLFPLTDLFLHHREEAEMSLLESLAGMVSPEEGRSGSVKLSLGNLRWELEVERKETPAPLESGSTENILLLGAVPEGESESAAPKGLLILRPEEFTSGPASAWDSRGRLLGFVEKGRLHRLHLPGRRFLQGYSKSESAKELLDSWREGRWTQGVTELSGYLKETGLAGRMEGKRLRALLLKEMEDESSLSYLVKRRLPGVLLLLAGGILILVAIMAMAKISGRGSFLRIRFRAKELPCSVDPLPDKENLPGEESDTEGAENPFREEENPEDPLP